MESIIYNTQGKKAGTVDLPESVFGVPWNSALVHQVVTSMQANARPTVAHVKTRGEVRGGGKKPWKQKGTGRARHGSIRSPIWKGGGVTHGPRKEKSYYRAIPKNMRSRALAVVLSKKARDGALLCVERFDMTAPKTAEAKSALVALSTVSGFEMLATKHRNSAFIALAAPNEATQKSFRNIGSMRIDTVANLNPVSVLAHKYLIIEDPKKSFDTLVARLSKKSRTSKLKTKN